MSTVLVLIDHDRGALAEESLQGVAFARSLAAGIGADVQAVAVGEDVDLAALGSHGVSKATQVEHPVLTDFAPEAWGDALAQVVEAIQPVAVIATGSERGNEVMAHLAAILDLAFAANVTELDPGDDPWELTRVRWGGSLLERARLEGAIKLLSVAPHSWEAQAVNGGSCEVDHFSAELSQDADRTRVVDRVTLSEGITLATAPVVVSGGRGVGSAEGFEPLEELAELLGGAVGCSRVVTNNGWRPHSDQVGQTGTRVAPDLYIACGISGAIQHWVGMMAAKKVLAINTDPEAPMVTKADWAVVGDLHQILPAILEEVRRRKTGA